MKMLIVALVAFFAVLPAQAAEWDKFNIEQLFPKDRLVLLEELPGHGKLIRLSGQLGVGLNGNMTVLAAQNKVDAFLRRNHRKFGAIIKKELQKMMAQNGVTRADVANKLGLSVAELNQVVHGLQTVQGTRELVLNGTLPPELVAHLPKKFGNKVGQLNRFAAAFEAFDNAPVRLEGHVHVEGFRTYFNNQEKGALQEAFTLRAYIQPGNEAVMSFGAIGAEHRGLLANTETFGLKLGLTGQFNTADLGYTVRGVSRQKPGQKAKSRVVYNGTFDNVPLAEVGLAAALEYFDGNSNTLELSGRIDNAATLTGNKANAFGREPDAALRIGFIRLF